MNNLPMLKCWVLLLLLAFSIQVNAQNYPYLTQLSGASQGTLEYPNSIAMDGAGKFYVSNSGTRNIQVLTLTGSALKYITHYPIPYLDSLGEYYEWPNLNGMAVLSPNLIVASDGNSNSILLLSITGNNLEIYSKFGSTGTAPGQFSNPSSVSIDGSGKVYVSDNDNNRIQVLTVNGTNIGVYTTYGSSGIGNGQFDELVGIVLGPNNLIYAMDAINYRFQVLTVNGTNISYVNQITCSYGTAPGEFENFTGLTIDNVGKIYISDAGNGRIQIFTTSGINLGYYSQYGSAGTAPGQLLYPLGVAVDDVSGDIIVVDSDNSRLQVITTLGTSLGFASQFGNSRSNSWIDFPVGITSSKSNTIYVVDNSSYSLDVLTISGTNIGIQKSILLSNGTIGSSVVPFGVGYDNSKNLTYVADEENDVLITITSSGTQLGTANVTGSYGTSPGSFFIPYDIAVDNQGRVYVADGLNNRIQVFTASGTSLTYYTSFGSTGTASGYFSQPVGITVDSDYKIYVSDLGNNRVQILTMSGANIGYYTQFGMKGFGNGQFLYPTDIAIDGAGKIFITDYINNRIQVFTASGTNVEYIDQFGSLGTGNGQFISPIALTIDQVGRIFVSDIGNSRIQVFTGAAPSNSSGLSNIQSNELEENPLQVFPNPFHDSFKIKLSGQVGNGAIAMYNLQGQVVYQGNITAGNDKVDINPNIPSGIYILLVQKDSKTQYLKLVKN